MRKLLTLLSICASVYYNAQVICGGQSATLTATNPQNLTNPQYTLNPGNFSPINGNQFQVTPASTSSYTILTVGTNSNNVVTTTSAVVTVTVNPQPLVAITLTQTSCTNTLTGFNLGLTFNPPLPTPGYTITWLTIPNGILSPQQTATTGVLPGVYSATIGATGGCSVYPTFSLFPNPAPASFSLVPLGPTYSITCATTSINVKASATAYSYTWNSTSAAPVVDSTNVTLTVVNLGTHTVTGKNPISGCVKTMTFSLVQNITPPSFTVNPTSQIITCSLNSISTVTLVCTPTVNVAWAITDPQGGTFAPLSPTVIYQPTGVGVYTACVANLENGCTTCKNFSVTSTQGFPTFTLQSPQNFSLGCNTRSVAVLNIVNASASTPGAGVSYTLIGPATSSVLPTGTLSGNSSYSVNTPGNYTVVVRELPSNCETRSNISILSNTFVPDISATVPRNVLDCDHTVTVLQGSSLSENVSFSWGYGSPVISVASSSIQATTNAVPSVSSKTLVNNYTLTVTDNSSTCKSTFFLPIFQNLYTPTARFSLSTKSITCLTPTITLTNISLSNIPAVSNGTIAAPVSGVIGFHWEGPPPADPDDNNTTYLAGIPGDYTLTAKDPNNGCLSTTVQTIPDGRDFPTILFAPATASLNCDEPIQLFTTPALGTSVVPTWKNPNNAPSGDKTKAILTGVNFTGIYTLTVFDPSNGCIGSNTVQVVTGSLRAINQVDRIEGFAPLTVLVTNQSTTGVESPAATKNDSTYYIRSRFSFGNGTYSATVNPSIQVSTIYKAPGTYSLAMTVKKRGLCADTLVRYIKVLLPSKIEVPNVFTPNGDGVNDLYFLNAANITEVTFTVHDRWGHLVYDLNSLTGNIVWDGKSQTGAEVADGVYFYTMKATGLDGNSFEQKGTITVVR